MLVNRMLFLFLVLSTHMACQSEAPMTYEPLKPFDPEQYVIYKTDEAIEVDGRAAESAWDKTAWTQSFVDIEGTVKPLPTWDTKVKMLWDETYLYIYAKMEEPHIWGSLKNRDDIIFLDDDIEVFIDPDGDTHHYYELELNALNTLWDLFMMWPYRQQMGSNNLFHWNIRGIKTATHIEGTINDPSDIDEYWSAEMAIPWDALIEMANPKRIPKEGDQWRFNFSRVDWTMEVKDGSYQKVLGDNGKPLPENNWVWSPTGKINMHMPESWGYVQFSEQMVGSNQIAFEEKPDEVIKWALWQLYFQQKQFLETHGEYQSAMSSFKIPKVAQCRFEPEVYVTPHMFELVASSCDGAGMWFINQEGRIYFRKK